MSPSLSRIMFLLGTPIKYEPAMIREGIIQFMEVDDAIVVDVKRAEEITRVVNFLLSYAPPTTHRVR